MSLFLNGKNANSNTVTNGGVNNNYDSDKLIKSLSAPASPRQNKYISSSTKAFSIEDNNITNSILLEQPSANKGM